MNKEPTEEVRPATNPAKDCLAAYRKATAAGTKSRDAYLEFGEHYIQIKKDIGVSGKGLSIILKELHPEVAAIDDRMRSAAEWFASKFKEVLAWLDETDSALVLPTSIRDAFNEANKQPKDKKDPDINMTAVLKALGKFMPEAINEDDENLIEVTGYAKEIAELLVKMREAANPLKVAA